MPYLILEEDKELRNKVMQSIKNGNDVILSHPKLNLFEI